MAEQYLNEALNSQGGKVYTAARKDADGKPITDTKLYAEDANGNKVAIKTDAGGNVLTQLTGSVVEDYYEGNADYSKTYQSPMVGVSIANDGLEILTFVINGVTRTVYPGEPYNAILKPFTTIQINAVDSYRLEVLQ